MEIRLAAPADVDAIAAVHRLSRATYYGSSPDANDGREDMWAHFLADPDMVTHVVLTSGHVDAVMSARWVTDPEPAYELSAFYVHPDRTGQGIGSRLYEVFEDGRSGHEPAVLEVWDGNERAIRFYERRGWRRTGVTRPGPQGNPYVAYRLDANPV